MINSLPECYIIIILIIIAGCNTTFIKETPIPNNPIVETPEETAEPVTQPPKETVIGETPQTFFPIEGEVLLPKNFSKTISQWYNNSIEKRSVEWGICFYGYSYDLRQNYTGYYVLAVKEAGSKDATRKDVTLTCNLYAYEAPYIGDAHIHFSNNILPSFQDTTTWAHIADRERKVHCVFLKNNSINCYSWKGYPIKTA